MIHKHKSETKVATRINDVAYIITESLSGLGDEKKYEIERVEGFDLKLWFEEWDEGSMDDWMTMFGSLIGMAEAANELIEDNF